MKVGIAVIALAMLAPAHFASGAEKTSPSAAIAANGGPVLQVADLMGGVDRHKGTIRVEGLVRKVFPKEQKLGLMDATEFKICGMVSNCCGNEVLPVQWSGPMPELKDVVQVEGEVRKVGDKLEFAARSLEKVPLQ